MCIILFGTVSLSRPDVPSSEEVKKVLQHLPDEVIVELCIATAVPGWTKATRDHVERQLADVLLQEFIAGNARHAGRLM